MLTKRYRKQFCKHGHDISICGRNSHGRCIQCRDDARQSQKIQRRLTKRPRARKQFCVKGHDTFVCGRSKGIHGSCNECNAQYRKRYQEYNGPKVRARNRQYGYRKSGILNEFGLLFSNEDFLRHFTLQEEKCKLCGIHQDQLEKILVVDHDHATKKFRGLLCANCNKHIVGSNTIESTLKLLQYLEEK